MSKRKLRVMIDDVELDFSLYHNFIDSDKLDIVIDNEVKRRKLNGQLDLDTVGSKLDLDTVVSKLNAFIKKNQISITKTGGLHQPHKLEKCHCIGPQECHEFQHELKVNICGYFKTSSEILYKYHIDIYQEIYCGDRVYFSKPKEIKLTFEWISNIKIHKYPNIVELIKIHINNIQKEITDEDDFSYSIDPLLVEIRDEIVSKCKYMKTYKQKYQNDTHCGKKECNVCRLAANFDYPAYDFLINK